MMTPRLDININNFDKKKPFGIYGFGIAGRRIALHLKKIGHPPAAFIDRRAEPGQLIDGINCISPTDLKNSGIKQAILGVFNREASPKTIANLLTDFGVDVVVGHNQINEIFPGAVKRSFWFDPDLDHGKTKAELSNVSELLEDPQSKLTLQKVLKYRLSGRIEDHPDGDGIDKQYFQVNIPGWLRRERIGMIDCGAFDGDTIRSAIKLSPNIVRAICFEPDQQNFQFLVDTCSNQNKIACTLIPCATWSKTQKVFFEENSGESSKVSDSGVTATQAVAIDDLIASSKYEFIKVDVEGADLETLHGAIKSIQSQRPYIAVAVYHKPQDLWEIPLFLNSSLEKYSFYLRQHGENCIDTVLYCVPTER
jgi:FkbM family methyltransferase